MVRLVSRGGRDESLFLVEETDLGVNRTRVVSGRRVQGRVGHDTDTCGPSVH